MTHLVGCDYNRHVMQTPKKKESEEKEVEVADDDHA